MTSLLISRKREWEAIINDDAVNNGTTTTNSQDIVVNANKRRKLYLQNQPPPSSNSPPPIKPRSWAPPPSLPSLPSPPASFVQAIDYVSPQLSLGSGGAPPSFIIDLKINDNSNPSDATASNSPTKRRIIGEYEILHESHDILNATNGGNSSSGGNIGTIPAVGYSAVVGQLKTYVVRHVITDELALCRNIDFPKFTHYMNVYRRLTDPLPREYIKGDYEDEEILPKLWPESTVLFSERDSAGLLRHYVVSPRHFGTLHTYVIDKKKMEEPEAKSIYKQVVRMMAYCHDRGIVVRDVKLRKFVFVDHTQREIRLNDLDELYVCPDRYVDTMQERHGCPAYVSPEIIDLSTNHYAGKPADVWGLGVLLYVLLVGRYPFYDTTPSGLFGKIRSAKFAISEQNNVSYELRCIIRCLLRKYPDERPSAQALLKLPWLTRSRDDSYVKVDAQSKSLTGGGGQQRNANDQSSANTAADSSGDQCVPSVEPKFVSTATSTNKKQAPPRLRDSADASAAVNLFSDQQLYADVY